MCFSRITKFIWNLVRTLPHNHLASSDLISHHLTPSDAISQSQYGLSPLFCFLDEIPWCDIAIASLSHRHSIASSQLPLHSKFPLYTKLPLYRNSHFIASPCYRISHICVKAPIPCPSPTRYCDHPSIVWLTLAHPMAYMHIAIIYCKSHIASHYHSKLSLLPLPSAMLPRCDIAVAYHTPPMHVSIAYRNHYRIYVKALNPLPFTAAILWLLLGHMIHPCMIQQPTFIHFYFIHSDRSRPSNQESPA